MAMMFHCFWSAAVGNHANYEATADENRVFDLVTKSKEKYSDVRDLKVIYGQLMDFVERTRVTEWTFETHPDEL